MLPSLQQSRALLQGPASALPPQLPAVRHSPSNPPVSLLGSAAVGTAWQCCGWLGGQVLQEMQPMISYGKSPRNPPAVPQWVSLAPQGAEL